jgi:hypothetical protein
METFMTRKMQTTMPATIKFGALAPEALERIDHSDATHAAASAHYRFETRMQELRCQTKRRRRKSAPKTCPNSVR